MSILCPVCKKKLLKSNISNTRTVNKRKEIQCSNCGTWLFPDTFMVWVRILGLAVLLMTSLANIMLDVDSDWQLRLSLIGFLGVCGAAMRHFVCNGTPLKRLIKLNNDHRL